MSNAAENKAIVGRWFTACWGQTCDLPIVDALAAPDMLLPYSLHAPRRDRDDIKACLTAFRTACPALNFWGAADLIAEGDSVVGRWEGGGTHTGPACRDFLLGALPAAPGRTMHGTGTTVLRLQEGQIVEEIGFDDGVTALQQLGRITAVPSPCVSRATRAGQPPASSSPRGPAHLIGHPCTLWSTPWLAVAA